MEKNYSGAEEKINQDNEAALGGLAIAETELAPSKLFRVDDETLLAVAPGIRRLNEPFVDLFKSFQGIHKNRKAEDQQTDVRDKPEKSSPTRETKRKVHGDKRSMSLRGNIVVKGAYYLSTFDDKEEAAQAGRQIFFKDFDRALPTIYENRIIPAAAAIKNLREINKEVIETIETDLQGEEEDKIVSRYSLLKAISSDVRNLKNEEVQIDDDFNDLSPVGTLSAAILMNGSRLPREIAIEAQTGAFDEYIARDMLEFADTCKAENLTGELEKLRQLVSCIDAYNRQTVQGEIPRSDIYKALALTIENWPAAQQQIVIEERIKIIDRLGSNLSRMQQDFAKDGLVGVDKDPAQSFHNSIKNYFQEIVKRATFDSAVMSKTEFVAARAQYGGGKRRKSTTKAEDRRSNRQNRARQEERKRLAAFAIPEAEVEPISIVSYDADNNLTESTKSLVDRYLESISQAGNTALREDVDNIIRYMQRSDRPLNEPGGIKFMKGQRVSVGEKGYRLFELKPTDASGLPLKTAIAKNSRLYFVNLGPKTRLLLDISLRSKQNEVVGSLSNS